MVSGNSPTDKPKEVAQDPAPELRWYAVRTRSRHEKRVHAQLADRPGIDVFLPLRERRSRWKDRVKRVVLSVTLIRQSASVEVDVADVTPV